MGKMRHYRDLSDHWDLGRYLYLFPSLTTVFFLAQSFRPMLFGSALVLSLLHWCPKALKLSLMISPSILERKRCQTRLESRFTDSPTQKSTWFSFDRWLCLLLLELAPSWLEHRSWSLPTCVAVLGGLYPSLEASKLTPHLKS